MHNITTKLFSFQQLIQTGNRWSGVPTCIHFPPAIDGTARERKERRGKFFSYFKKFIPIRIVLEVPSSSSRAYLHLSNLLCGRERERERTLAPTCIKRKRRKGGEGRNGDENNKVKKQFRDVNCKHR
jgi:hypothetical protein